MSAFVSQVRRIALAAVLLGLPTGVVPVFAQQPSDADVREASRREQMLAQQLDQLNSARDPAASQRLMRQHWQGMQDYMTWMHQRWDVGQPSMRGVPGMGCPMMGSSTAASWDLPQGANAPQYGQQMQGTMSAMHRQMTDISRAADPAERRRLMQQHWQTMYQHMQTTRGMGWMWAGPTRPGMMWRPMPGAGAAAPLPESGSRGAVLVNTYCTQCHAAPSPSLHTAAEWAAVTTRMRDQMQSTVSGIKVPSASDMQLILTYMQQHGR